MAITKCPECGTEVSDKAEKCPKCAYPISGQQGVQTIALTSKKFKKQILLSTLIIIIGAIVAMISLGTSDSGSVFFVGFLTFFIGLVWFLAVKTKIWWHHK